MVIIFRKLRMKKVKAGTYQAWFDYENNQFLLTVTGANTSDYRMKFEVAYTEQENTNAELHQLRQLQHCIFDTLTSVITMCALSGETTIDELDIEINNECCHKALNKYDEDPITKQ